MMHARRVAILLTLALALAACSLDGSPETPGATPQPTQAPAQPAALSPQPAQAPQPLYLAIIWHQHQPVYYKDPASGIYAKPWVRLHAAKDYVDMAQMLQKYPNIHVTFNLTPSLLRQLRDIEGGARDTYWTATTKDAASLTPDDKRFILRHFFDANPKIINRFPRFAALRARRGDATDDAALDRVAVSWTPADFRDLQVLFNLGWTDPDWLAQPPLKALVEKREGYGEEDKQVVLNRHLELVKEVIPLHAGMQETGQIEITMTPYAHPILPLLVSTAAAAQALPDAKLPEPFIYGQDAQAQVEQGVALYKELFGRAPRGMWPAEGSVSQLIVPMVARAGLTWMASDEGVLAQSLDLHQFDRDSRETVKAVDQLYQPYTVGDDRGNQVTMVFRDRTLSDKVGFTYSGQSGEAAASDFIARLHNVQAALKDRRGPHLVTVILDGENAWENYDNDGKEFLTTLYQKLSDDPSIKTVTPSEYLAQFPPQTKIADLWSGSWINADFSTWIGEPEENKAWDLLRAARETLQKYISGVRTVDPAALKQAQDLMYVAEGSDWFWWYGADQDSGDDASFDIQFRDTLREMYAALGAAPPDALLVPIIAVAPSAPETPLAGAITPAIDGQAAAGEWDAAGRFTISGGVAQSGDDIVGGLLYGFDANNLYVRLDARNAWSDLGADGTLGVYLSAPGAPATSPFARGGAAGQRTLLGFDAGALAEVHLVAGKLAGPVVLSDAAPGGWAPTPRAELQAAAGDKTIELAIPLALLGQFEAGDSLAMRVVAARSGAAIQSVPAASQATVQVPDLGLSTAILDIVDPEGDDHGPGSYTYPQDKVFGAGVFDLTAFSVAQDENSLIFKLAVKGGIDNVWNSPRGLAVQTFDIYIDANDQANSSRLLFPGRNAAFPQGQGWNYGVWIEGWEGGLYKAVPNGAPQKVGVELKMIVDGKAGRVTVRLPKSALPPGDPTTWRYMAAVMGQEGFPSAGVWRVRDIAPAAQQWRFGGALPGSNGTRIIDLALPADADPKQEDALKPARPSQEANLDALGPDDFAQVPLLGAK